jgi:hypothetical protein
VKADDNNRTREMDGVKGGHGEIGNKLFQVFQTLGLPLDLDHGIVPFRMR